ncbi:MAG: UDP-N-acetylmuramoyl-tripeptide--D-alanyl-D-alanine ligase [Oscillospiraceae bacterium]|nr:UDP-N-acetylmuramoyl-tripeptide--D-alanyl-D-alanine ligase [Oscillospiraceae bacterium]
MDFFTLLGVSLGGLTLYLLFNNIITVALGIVTLFNFIHYAHIFQLNSYSTTAQLKWYGKNITNLLFRQCFFLLFLVIVYFYTFYFAQPVYISALYYAILSVLPLTIASLFVSFPRKAKKRFVFTPRVIRMLASSAIIIAALFYYIWSIYYYYNGFMLFVAIFIFYSFNPFIIIIANFVNKPIEWLVRRYYINDAKKILESHKNLVVIAITGSYGKTSVKYYLSELLSAKYNTLMTPESYNTPMGVVKTIRTQLSGAHEIFVCEMGANRLHDIKELCEIVQPTHSILTAIGEQHLETFKSLDNIITTKFEIADAIVNTGGTLFLNYDNEHIRNKQIANKNVITYGLENSKSDYYASDIKVSVKGTSFNLHAKGEVQRFETALIGEHNVQNIVGGMSAAHFMGVSLNELYLPVKRLKSVPHRMELIDGGERVIIDDSFNSNPNGAKAALGVLKMLEGTRFLVTPGMVELGSREKQLNKELGENAAECCDYAVLVGEKQAPPIIEGLKEKGFPQDKIHIAKSLKEAMAHIEQIPTTGKKIILLENDLPDNY